MVLKGEPNNSDEPEHSNDYKERTRSTIDTLNKQSSELSGRLDAAKFRRLMLEKCLKQAAEASKLSGWLQNIDRLEIDPLEQLFKSLCQVSARVTARLNELICAGESSSSSAQIFNHCSRVGLNLLNPMTNGLNHESYEESCAPLSTGEFKLGSIRSEMYPLNIAAVNEGSIKLNSNSGGSIDAEAQAINNYDFEALIPLEEFDFTTELTQFDQLFSAEDLIDQNQTDPGTTGSNTNIDT